MAPASKARSSSHGVYVKPRRLGGILIRRVIAFLRSQNITLPITSHILCAVSGGSDSVALCHLLCRYGRRIVPSGQVTLVHINHGWRGAESDQDQQLVEDLAQRLDVPCLSFRSGTRRMAGRSWEEVAREQRKAIFERLSEERGGAPVLTAHHADDLAETVLWRILTGAADTHGGGIFATYGREIRPLLAVRKAELREYLLEEGEVWREDRTNGEGRFLRSRMRLEVFPPVQKLFPRAVDRLAALGLKAQEALPRPEPLERGGRESSLGELASWLGTVGVRARRPHWELLRRQLERQENWEGTVDLPGGWRLIRQVMTCARPCSDGASRNAGGPGQSRMEAKQGLRGNRKKSKDPGTQKPIKERWILEKS